MSVAWDDYRKTETVVQLDRRLDEATRIGRELKRKLQTSPEAAEIRKIVDAIGKSDFCGPTLGVNWSGRAADDHEMFAAWTWTHTPGRHERASGKTPAELLAAVRAEIRRQGIQLRSGRVAEAVAAALSSTEKASDLLSVAINIAPERSDLVDSLRLVSEALDRLKQVGVLK